MSQRIPATVITGFLGSGKTTIIRHLIENADGRRIALIVNEFGDVGVDGEVLKSCGNPNCSDDDIIELANGCICCTVAEDFIPTMEKLLAREQRPDHIVIETSGLALPQPLVRAFKWPEIRSRVTVDGVVTLVDAAALAAGRFASDEKAVAAQRSADAMLDHETPLGELFEDQLSCADLVVVSKSDLVEAPVLADIETRVSEEARPGVRLVRSAHGEIPGDVLLGLAAGAEGENRFSHHERAHLAAGEDISHMHDHDDFESFALAGDSISEPADFAETLAALMRDHDILRLKGFCHVPDKEMRLVVQAVGPRVETYFDRNWREDEARNTRLVVIGKAGLRRETIAEQLAMAVI